MFRYIRTDTLVLVRSAYFLVFSVAFSAGFYLLLTVLMREGFGARPETKTNLMIAMSISGAFFGALNGGAIRLGTERGDGWTRQVLLTPLSPAGYLGAKAITAWLLTLPAVVVVFVLGMTVNRVSLPTGRWGMLIITTWVGCLVFVAMGIALGLLIVGEAAQFVSLGLFLPLAMVGGLWFPLDLFPDRVAGFAGYLPTRALYQVVLHVLTGSDDSLAMPILVLLAWTTVFAVVALQRSRSAVLAKV